MAKHKSVVEWGRDGAVFTDNRYSRGHRWIFDGGLEVPASSSPHVIPVPLSILEAIDPEEAFVASLSSCHMLWFLSIAARRGFVVDNYRDEAVGVMSKDKAGNLAMTLVTLRPATTFGGERKPSFAEVESMHDEAHQQCFLARSVKSEVRCEPIEPVTLRESPR
jgi:organic hydroperoxide reductase OsmC/OhrA